MATSAWITVIGIGDDGVAGLSPRARAALDAARVVFGGARHLAMIDRPERGIAWRSPIAGSMADVEEARPGPVAVLASGDPSWFGVARMFLRHRHDGEVAILPAVSSFALAASSLCWPMEETTCLSACGRPVEDVWPHLRPHARLIVLSSGAQTPGELAHGLVERGYGQSTMWVMGHLGGERESCRRLTAQTFRDGDFPALNLVAVECELVGGARWYPPVPGLPDAAFATDGTMTKRVLRAAALSALAPRPGERLWDVGAGSGSIAIEWLRVARGARAIAIEPREDRRALIAQNAVRLCVAGLSVAGGSAPEVFAGLDAPDAVFFGGGVTERAVETAIEALRVRGGHGRLVAHGVTVETQGLIAALHARHGGEMLRIGVETAEPLGGFRAWRPAMPVVHRHWTKAGE